MECKDREEVFLNILHGFSHLNISTALHVVTQSEFFLLSMVRRFGDYSENHSESINVSRLAEVLSVSSAAVSRTLRGLEEKQYLERVTDSENKRNTYVRLTPAGRRLFEDENLYIENLTGRIFSRMGEENMKTLFELSKKLHEITADEIEKLKNGGQPGENEQTAPV